MGDDVDAIKDVEFSIYQHAVTKYKPKQSSYNMGQIFFSYWLAKGFEPKLGWISHYTKKTIAEDATEKSKYEKSLKEYNFLVYIFDITKPNTFEGLKFWLELEGDKKAAKIILGTNLEHENDRKITIEEARKFAEQQGASYFEIRADEGKGCTDKPIKKLMKVLKEKAEDQQEARIKEFLDVLNAEGNLDAFNEYYWESFREDVLPTLRPELLEDLMPLIKNAAPEIKSVMQIVFVYFAKVNSILNSDLDEDIERENKNMVEFLRSLSECKELTEATIKKVYEQHVMRKWQDVYINLKSAHPWFLEPHIEMRTAAQKKTEQEDRKKEEAKRLAEEKRLEEAEEKKMADLICLLSGNKLQSKTENQEDDIEFLEHEKSHYTERKKIVRFEVDRSSGEPRAKLYIPKAASNLSVDKIKKLFSLKGFFEPETFEEDGRVVLFINYREDQQKEGRPKDSKLVDALLVLNHNNLYLSEQSHQGLLQAFNENCKVIDKAQEEARKTNSPAALYLDAYQSVFLGLDIYFKSSQAKVAYSTVDKNCGINESNKDESNSASNEEGEEKHERLKGQVEKKAIEILGSSALVYSVQENPSKLVSVTIFDDEWDAYVSSPKKGEDLAQNVLNFVATLYEDKNDSDYELNVSTLHREVQKALRNLVAYAGELQGQYNALESDSKDESLEIKLGQLRVFMRNILEQEELTPDSLQQAYDDFQKNDKNRGTGFYRVHSFFHNKRYDGWHLVKSASGELAYNLMDALKKYSPNPRVDDDMDQSPSLT